MSLKITRLSLRGFRSYQEFTLFPDSDLTIIAGPNAAGKTNILEALQLLTAASSFRNPVWGECVKWGSEEARISTKAEGEGRDIEVSLSITPTGKRSYEVNGSARRRISEMERYLPCVVFTPDDLRMVKDSAERRRASLDGLGDQLSPAYCVLRTEYDRILKQRNALLKEEASDPLLMDTLTRSLVEKGGAFSEYRKRLFARVADKLSEAYSRLSNNEQTSAVYVSSWQREDKEEGSDDSSLMEDALALRGPEERARRTTLVGPHRDEIRFLIDGRDSRSYASQGQQRTIALAWKLAEVGVITEVSGQPPLLLLDDVMSELDQTRRRALASFVGDAAQTVVTTTNLGYFEEEMIERAKVVDLS